MTNGGSNNFPDDGGCAVPIRRGHSIDESRIAEFLVRGLAEEVESGTEDVRWIVLGRAGPACRPVTEPRRSASRAFVVECIVSSADGRCGAGGLAGLGVFTESAASQLEHAALKVVVA